MICPHRSPHSTLTLHTHTHMSTEVHRCHFLPGWTTNTYDFAKMKVVFRSLSSMVWGILWLRNYAFLELWLRNNGTSRARIQLPGSSAGLKLLPDRHCITWTWVYWIINHNQIEGIPHLSNCYFIHILMSPCPISEKPCRLFPFLARMIICNSSVCKIIYNVRLPLTHPLFWYFSLLPSLT